MIGATRGRSLGLQSNAGNTGVAILIQRSRRGHGKDKRIENYFKLSWKAVATKDGQRLSWSFKEELKMP